jgi:uncharacterized membrane protein
LIKKTISLICTCMWISILSNFVSTGICVCTCMWIPILSNFVSSFHRIKFQPEKRMSYIYMCMHIYM